MARLIPEARWASLVDAASILLVFGACGHPPGAAAGHDAILGSERAVATQDGSYDGYRVIRRCASAGCIGVVGQGANWAPGMERDRIADDVRFRAGFEQFRARVTGALRGFVSIHQSGLGGGCTNFGLFLGMNDWREVDGVIARVGRLLRDDALREEVTLCITAAPQLERANDEARREPWRH